MTIYYKDKYDHTEMIISGYCWINIIAPDYDLNICSLGAYSSIQVIDRYTGFRIVKLRK